MYKNEERQEARSVSSLLDTLSNNTEISPIHPERLLNAQARLKKGVTTGPFDQQEH